MRRQITILLIAIGLLTAPNVVHARSYSFLVHAIREYNANPSAETEGRLHAAQRKASAIDVGIWAVPVLLGLYVVVRIKTGRSKRESNHTPDGIRR
jgi:hypothetical protein